MKIFIFISVTLLFNLLIPNQASAASGYKLDVCDLCSSSKMRARAKSYGIVNRTVEVQVVNPSSGVVKAYKVRSIREPGFETIDIYPTSVRSDVAEGARQAKKRLITIRAKISLHSDILNKVKDLYPNASANQMSMHVIPGKVAPSAMVITHYTDADSIFTGQYLSQQIGTPTASIVDMILSRVLHMAIAVFSDGSIMVFYKSAWSSIQWRIMGDYKIDGQGRIRKVITGAVVSPSTSTGSSGGDPGFVDGGSVTFSSTGAGTEWCFVQNGYTTYCWVEYNN